MNQDLLHFNLPKRQIVAVSQVLKWFLFLFLFFAIVFFSFCFTLSWDYFSLVLIYNYLLQALYHILGICCLLYFYCVAVASLIGITASFS